MSEWFVVMTLQAPVPSGFASATKTTVVTAKSGTTREQLFGYMRGLFPAEFARANVVFFSAEPNQLGGAR